MKLSDLNLYVWDDVLEDYTSGGVVVLARSVEEARRLAAEPGFTVQGSYPKGHKFDQPMTLQPDQLDTEPKVYPIKNGPAAILAVYGGG